MSKCHVMCCVKGCTNRLKTDSRLHFYKFPKKSIYTPWRMEKRNLWIEAVRPHVKIPKNRERSEWDPKDRTVICSAHFISGAKGEHPQDPAYLPTIFPKLTITITTYNPSKHHLRSTEDIKMMEDGIAQSSKMQSAELPEIEDYDETKFDSESIIEPFSPLLCSVACQTDLEYDDDVEITTFLCTFNSENGINCAGVQANIKCNEQRNQKNHDMKRKTQHVACSVSEADAPLCRGFHGFSSIRSDEEAKHLCGVPLATFEFILNTLPEMDDLELSKQNLLCLFLIKMKLGLSFTCLRVLFNVQRASVPKIFKEVLQCLAVTLSECTFWPKKRTVQASLPESFQDDYKNCRVIVDCLEFKIETPVTLKDKNLTWSENKRIYTFKVLIGCTPNGFISFVSKSYTGSMNDKFIALDSGLLDKLESNDLVLTSRKFPRIERKGRKKNSTVPMPSSLPKIQSFQKIKQFQIFKLITTELFPYVDDMVTVVCALVNLSPSDDLDDDRND